MPDRLIPEMALSFWFSLAPLPWWELTKMVLTAILGLTVAHFAPTMRGVWRAVSSVLSYVLVGLALLHALLIAHNDAVGRCLIVLESIY